VFYNGKNKWTPIKNLSKYQEGSEYFGDFISCRYILVDANKIKPKELISKLSAISAIITADKKRDSELLDFIKTLKELVSAKEWEANPDGYEDFVFWIVNALKRFGATEAVANELMEQMKGETDMEIYATDYIAERMKAEYVAQGKISVFFSKLNYSIEQIAQELNVAEDFVRETLEKLGLIES
jgi:hypothetical protein